jgi:hypothetical protein
MTRTVLWAALIAAFAVLVASAAAAQEGATATAAGITFRTLSAKDLDAIETETGFRVGVEVTAVKAGSAAAAAGVKVKDLIFAVGDSGVDNAEQAAAEVEGRQGEIAFVAATMVNGEYQPTKYTLQKNAGAKPAANGSKPAAPAAETSPAKPSTDPVTAYFDMMDFIRTKAWGRQITTSTSERERVAVTLATLDLDQQTQATLLQIPGAWSKLQKQWAGFSDAQKNKQREQWQDQLLMPGGMYPPPQNPQQFTAPQGLGVAFQFPGEWTGGWTESNGTPLLFLGPNGGQAGWKQVLDTPKSPAGALFALIQVPPELRNKSYIQGAEYLAHELIPKGIEKLKVVQRLPIGDVGAVITFSGKFPGQTEEKFYWIGITKFGDSQVFAGRMGGPVKDADKLVPAFTYILQTLQLSPPQAASGGVSGAWDAAWSRVSVGIVKNIWAPSGN